ncbi:MAG: hypothetical protein ACFFDN_24420 [Candidatus Hodarchaeota archaeon]
MNNKKLKNLDFQSKKRDVLEREVFDVADPKQKTEIKREYRTFWKSLSPKQRRELDEMLF